MQLSPTLRELQRALRVSLLANEDISAVADIIPNGIDPNARVAVYRNTFFGVLTTALRLVYPAVQRLVGPDFFEVAAHKYIERHPPKSAYLNSYGDLFPEFLAGFEPAATLPYLPDVARLEFAVNRAIHAEDAEQVNPTRLTQLGDADRARVSFSPNPSLTLLSAIYPVDSIWRAVLEQDDGALGAMDLSQGPVQLLVERFEGSSEVRRLSESAWQLASRLFAGLPLAIALEEAQHIDAPSLLAEHLAFGRFIDFRLAKLPLACAERNV